MLAFHSDTSLEGARKPILLIAQPALSDYPTITRLVTNADFEPKEASPAPGYEQTSEDQTELLCSLWLPVAPFTLYFTPELPVHWS